MMITLSSGHGKYIRGASGYLDEVDEARVVTEKVAHYLLQLGCGVVTFHDDLSTTQSENLETIVSWHNSVPCDLATSIHFNAYCTTHNPMGTEVLYLTAADRAAHVVNAIAHAGFVNRGAKYRDDLYFLNKTTEPAILIEVCFVDSSADAELYKLRFDGICRLIAAAISGRVAPSKTVPDNQRDITASVFGGASDPNVSAYDEGLVLDDVSPYVALPDRFEGARPLVRVTNSATGATAVAEILDVGPWNTTDDYWTMGTRPQAETGTDMQGRETNGAGIDLSPALAKMIGIDGLGLVNWDFVA